MKKTVYTRHIGPNLKEAMEDSPVVLIQGPRQCGKTTLAQMVGNPAGYAYRSFDDEDIRSFAETDPIGFVNDLPERVILDEVQKVPRLFSSIKLSVDRNRTPGRFILTGSVNVLQVREITDSLAGRMQIIRLHPLSQSELSQTPPKFLDSLFSSGFKHRHNKTPEEKIVHRIVAGGYPAALRLSSERRRVGWYKSYIEALVQGDVPDISNIRSPEILSDLLALAAAQTAQLLSVNGLSSSFQLSRPTVHDYLSLLKKMFLVETLPAWHNNRVKRLIKTPKLHLSDTGIACALMDLDQRALVSDRSLLGHVLETFVLQELQRQASGHKESHKFFHYREKMDKETEVDIVIQRGAFNLAGVEVKASATLNKSDFHGLRRLKAVAGKHFACGVLVYNGETSGKIDDKLYAVPLRSLWEAN